MPQNGKENALAPAKGARTGFTLASQRGGQHIGAGEVGEARVHGCLRRARTIHWRRRGEGERGENPPRREIFGHPTTGEREESDMGENGERRGDMLAGGLRRKVERDERTYKALEETQARMGGQEGKYLQGKELPFHDSCDKWQLLAANDWSLVAHFISYQG